MSRPLSLRAYAAHRKELGLPGHSHESVRRAIESGRLERSVVMVAGKPKIRGVKMADKEWDASTRMRVDHPEGGAGDDDPDEAPPGADAPDEEITYKEAQRRREIERWRRERVQRETDELELGKRRGELVAVDEARADVVKRFAAVREKILGLPTRIRQRTEVSEGEVALITDLVYEALESIAMGADSDGSGEG